MALGFSSGPGEGEVRPYIERFKDLETKAKALRDLIAASTPSDGEAPGVYVPALDVVLGAGGKVETPEGKSFKFSGLAAHRDHLKKLASTGYKWSPTAKLNYLPLMREELSKEHTDQLIELLAAALQVSPTRDDSFLPRLDALWQEAKALEVTEAFEPAARAISVVWPDSRYNRFYVDELSSRLFSGLQQAVTQAKKSRK